MSYIYKITNNCNGKVYIGQSKVSLERKWELHMTDSKKVRDEKRPLYVAMNKYGAENFSISVVEDLEDDSILDEREIYWIDYYDSFRNGYNATYGGSGRNDIDYGLVYETYLQLGSNCKETAKKLSIDTETVSRAVKALSGSEVLYKPRPSSRRVNMFDLDGNYVRTFSSTREAARFVISEKNLNAKNENGYSCHISMACRGKRKTVHGYIWQYAAQ